MQTKPSTGPARGRPGRWGLLGLAVLAVGAATLLAVGPGDPSATRPGTPARSGAGTSAPAPSGATTPTAPPPATTTAPVPSTTTTTTAPPIGPGATGAAVIALQERLNALGYWVGTVTGTFGDTTEQAVYALQKAAGISRDGLVGPQTEAALDAGVVPQPRAMAGHVIEVDLADDLVLLVTDGALRWTLNTSTGGGYVYTGDLVAVTPPGVYQIFRQVDGMVTDNLGQLWRPKYFDGGIAIHGETDVPPVPVSHGCVRVSNDAIDWIWTSDLAPIGTTVWVFS